jgi:hypothetical protein
MASIEPLLYLKAIRSNIHTPFRPVQRRGYLVLEAAHDLSQVGRRLGEDSDREWRAGGVRQREFLRRHQVIHWRGKAVARARLAQQAIDVSVNLRPPLHVNVSPVGARAVIDTRPGIRRGQRAHHR